MQNLRSVLKRNATSALKPKMYLAIVGGSLMVMAGLICFIKMPDKTVGQNLIKGGLISDGLFLYFLVIYLVTNKKSRLSER